MNPSSLKRLPIVPEDLERNGSSAVKSVARMLASVLLGEVQGVSPEKIVGKSWPGDTQAALLTRAATSPFTTADAAALTPTKVGSFLYSLAPTSAAARLFDRCMKLNFDGVYQFVIPYPSLVPVPIFVAEGQSFPMVQATVGDTIVGPTKKILIGSAVTGEMQLYTPENAATIIGRVLNDQVARNLDRYVFDAVAGDDVRPPGLLYGVTPIAPTAGGGSNAMVKDVANIAAAISAAGGNADGMVIVASAAQALTLRLLAGPNFANSVFSTGMIPANTVIGVDPGAIATGYSGVPTVDTSKHVTAHFEDATPQPLMLAGPVRSAFQEDQLFLKVRLNAAYAALLTGAVQVVNNVTW